MLSYGNVTDLKRAAEALEQAIWEYLAYIVRRTPNLYYPGDRLCKAWRCLGCGASGKAAVMLGDPIIDRIARQHRRSKLSEGCVFNEDLVIVGPLPDPDSVSTAFRRLGPARPLTASAAR